MNGRAAKAVVVGSLEAFNKRARKGGETLNIEAPRISLFPASSSKPGAYILQHSHLLREWRRKR